MGSSTTVKVAAVQAAPVILDADRSVEKAIRLIGEAAGLGVELAVFPECFVSLYPQDHWGDSAELWARFYTSAIEVPGPQVDALIEACRAHQIYVVIGVNEREPARSGSVYNTMLILGPDGLLLRHRKLMPTFHERSWHAFGGGDDLQVVGLPFARVGGLICWENKMPLARYALYRQNPQIWVAPTADSSRGWHAVMSAIAIESGAYVVSVRSFQPHSAFPVDFPVELPAEDLHMDAAIFEPSEGDPIAGPLHDVEGIIVADCDLNVGIREKRFYDVTGHYGREDVLVPLLAKGP